MLRPKNNKQSGKHGIEELEQVIDSRLAQVAKTRLDAYPFLKVVNHATSHYIS